MKAFKLSNLFTVVVLILTVSNYSWAEVCAQFSLANGSLYTTVDESTCNSSVIPPDKKAACRSLAACVRRTSSGSTSSGEVDSGRCDGFLQSYQSKSDETAQQCAKSGVSSVNACISAANACNGGSSGISDSTNGDNPFAGIMNILSTSNRIGSNPQDSSECTIDEEADKKQQTADRIQSLRDEQQDAVTKQAEFDGEIADKQKEINEEIRKSKDEIQQSARDLDKEDREKFTSIQKALLESKKKKFKNLIAINKTNTEIANLEFAQQQVNIEFSESKVARKCYDKVLEIKNKLVPQAAPPVPGQPPAPNPARNFTLKEAQRIKQILRSEEDDCLKTERLSRAAQLKGKLDRRQELTDQISQANQDIADDDAAIKLDQDEYDKFKASLADEKKSKLDSQTQMETNLNNSLAQFQALVDKKKASQQARITSREELIQKLLTEKTAQKQRYAEVSASLFGRQESLQTFLDNCCGSNISRTSRNRSCGRLSSGSPTLEEPSTGNGGRGNN